MSPAPISLLNLPSKPFLQFYSIGTDICHIPRIQRLLATRGRRKAAWDKQAKIPEGRQLQEQDTADLRHALRFIGKILREEEVEQSREKWEEPLRRWGAARARWDVCVDIRRRLEDSKGAKNRKALAERKVPVLSGASAGKWEDLIYALNESHEGGSGGSNVGKADRLVVVLKVMNYVLWWKGKFKVQGWRTPWSYIEKSLGEGKDTEMLREGAVGYLETKRRELKGIREATKSREDVALDSSIEGLSSRDEAQALEVQREAGVFEEIEGVEEDIVSQQSSGEVSQVDKYKEVMGRPELQHGAQDDINAFLAIEEQLKAHVSNAESDLLAPARFLAGRFSAKEAIIKAHPHRRLLYHDIAVLKQPPNEFGSQPPKALVLDEEGASTTEVRLSISHDGEYAIATALAAVEGMSTTSAGRDVTARERARAWEDYRNARSKWKQVDLLRDSGEEVGGDEKRSWKEKDLGNGEGPKFLW